MPNAGFFVGRVLAGGLVGVLMLLALSLCEPYELLSEQSVWGMRMMILSSSRPREGIIQTLLVIAQLFALLIGAVSLLCTAAQSLKTCAQACRSVRWCCWHRSFCPPNGERNGGCMRRRSC